MVKSSKNNILIWVNLHQDLYLPIILFLIIGSIYYITLLPGVGYMGDTAKFQFLGKVLGTPHATGYPNYILLNHFFVNLFPFGTLAFKANFLSSIFTILSAFVFYRLLREISIRPIVSFSVVLTFCFAKTVWNQSLIAEVYTLNLLFTVLVSYFFVKWHLSKTDRYFYIACFLYALSFGNHLLMIALLPAIIYIVLITDRKVFTNPKKIFAVIIFIVIGLSQYLYLYWRTITPHTAYLETKVYNFQDLIAVLTGKQFHNSILAKLSLTQFFQRTWKFTFFFVREMLLFIPLPFISMLITNNRKIKIFFFLGFLANLIISFSYTIDDVWVYLIPSYFFLNILLALFIENVFVKLSQKAIVRWSFLILVIPFFFLTINFHRNDMSHDTKDKIFTESVLNYIGSNGIIINPGYDEFEYLEYYLIGEGLGQRKNIQLMNLEKVENYLQLNQTGQLNKIPVYILEDDQADVLQKKGYSPKKIFDNFYLIP